MNASRHAQARRQRALFVLILMAFGLAAHYGYAAMHQDRILFRRGEQQYLAGNPDQAMHLYRQALDSGLQWPHALIRVVEAALVTGNDPLVAQAIRNLFDSRVRPAPPELRNLAGLLDGSGRPELARDFLEHYPRQVLASPDLSLALAGLYRRDGRFLDAELLYRRLLGVPAVRDVATLELAVTFFIMGRTQQAESLLRQVLQTTPEDRRARIHLARVLTAQGRFHEAIQEYQTVLGDSR